MATHRGEIEYGSCGSELLVGRTKQSMRMENSLFTTILTQPNDIWRSEHRRAAHYLHPLALFSVFTYPHLLLYVNAMIVIPFLRGEKLTGVSGSLYSLDREVFGNPHVWFAEHRRYDFL